MPTPIILDTDIGTDVDDAFALLVALGEPTLDLKGVTTVYVDPPLRAQMVRKLLDFAGRQDVPVHPGEPVPLRPAARYPSGCWGWHEGRGLLYTKVSLDEKMVRAGARPPIRGHVEMRPEEKTAARFIYETACATPGLELVAIGPLTNVAVALMKYPDLASRLKRIVIMGGWFPREGMAPRGEHNFACDAAAAEIVLKSAVPLMILDFAVSQRTYIEMGRIEWMRRHPSPLARAVWRMVSIYCRSRGRAHTSLHDPATVMSLARPEVATFKKGTLYYDPRTAICSLRPFEGGAVSREVEYVDDVGTRAFHDAYYALLDRLFPR